MTDAFSLSSSLSLSLSLIYWFSVSFSHLFQDALVEELLQLLIAVVDAELLKAVVLEIFWRAKEGTGERE